MLETVAIDSVGIADDAIGTAIDLAAVGVVNFFSERSNGYFKGGK